MISPKSLILVGGNSLIPTQEKIINKVPVPIDNLIISLSLHNLWE